MRSTNTVVKSMQKRHSKMTRVTVSNRLAFLYIKPCCDYGRRRLHTKLL